MLNLQRPWAGTSGAGTFINWNSPQARGLVAAMPFNTAELDVTGLNTVNAATASIGVARSGGARVFSGSQDIRINTGTMLGAATNITLCCWATFTSFALAYNTVIGRNTTLQFCDIHVKSTGKLAVYLRDGTSTTRSYDGTGAFTLSAGKLYFLAITVSDTLLTGYVDAVFDGSSAVVSGVQAISGSGTLTVGNNPPNFPARYINGSVFDARAYNRALTQAELREIYLNRYALYKLNRRYVPTYVTSAAAPSITALSAINITATSAQPRISYS